MKDTQALVEEVKQLQISCYQAQYLGQFQAGFLARSAHELRSPLGSLIGLHQIIAFNLCETAEEEKEFIHQAYELAQKLMKIIDELVMVSKAHIGSDNSKNQSVKLINLLDNLYSLTHLIAANRNLKLEILYPNADVFILAEQNKLLQSLLYIIDQGIILTEEGKIKVWVNHQIDNNWLQINLDFPTIYSVWYEPINLLAEIPEPFSLKTSEVMVNPQLSGGMKLFLAQTLIEAMGGQLKIADVSPLEKKQPLTRLQCWIQKVPEILDDPE